MYPSSLQSLKRALPTAKHADEVVTLPADELKPESVVDGWFDEPQTVQDDIEEVVTYTLSIPHLTLASDAASETINDGMAQLQSALESYADDEVYKAALDAQAMAFVDGDYTISMADGKLILTYTLSGPLWGGRRG